MNNLETVLEELEKFEKKSVNDCDTLSEYLQYVAKSGDPVFPWCKIKTFIRYKLVEVMSEFYDKFGTEEDRESVNMPPFSYVPTRDRILQHFDTYIGAPFTIQRLCEILVDPHRHYHRADKFLRGLEKNILVVSYIDPGRKKCSDLHVGLVNGLQDSFALHSPESPHGYYGKSPKSNVKQTSSEILDNLNESKCEESHCRSSSPNSFSESESLSVLQEHSEGSQNKRLCVEMIDNEANVIGERTYSFESDTPVSIEESCNSIVSLQTSNLCVKVNYEENVSSQQYNLEKENENGKLDSWGISVENSCEEEPMDTGEAEAVVQGEGSEVSVKNAQTDDVSQNHDLVGTSNSCSYLSTNVEDNIIVEDHEVQSSDSTYLINHVQFEEFASAKLLQTIPDSAEDGNAAKELNEQESTSEATAVSEISATRDLLECQENTPRSKLEADSTSSQVQHALASGAATTFESSVTTQEILLSEKLGLSPKELSHSIDNTDKLSDINCPAEVDSSAEHEETDGKSGSDVKDNFCLENTIETDRCSSSKCDVQH